MAKINIPTKIPTSLFKADEVNLMVTAINEIDVDAKAPSHALSDEDFISTGTTTVAGKVIPVIELNPASPKLVTGGDFITQAQLNTAIATKADLVNGTVPVNQLPTFYFEAADFDGDGTQLNPFKLRV